MRMNQDQWDSLVAHAREDAPNECCGILWGRDGAIEDLERGENTKRSPYGFDFAYRTLSKANDLQDGGFEVYTYHSHPKSEPRPSQMDINMAQYPEWPWVIISLQDGDAPEIRAWWIVEGKVTEEPIEVA